MSGALHLDCMFGALIGIVLAFMAGFGIGRKRVPQ